MSRMQTSTFRNPTAKVGPCSGGPGLKRAVARLSEAYRAGRRTSEAGLSPAETVAAYLAVRHPATLAASTAVLGEARSRLPGETIRSLLDLGAGTGASAQAAAIVFPELKDLVLIEPDAAFAQAGRELLPDARWVAQMPEFPPSDLVLACYSLGELDRGSLPKVLAACWCAARTLLVLIEPGSTRGFAVIREARDYVLSLGAHMVAPCPHQGACPVPVGDWCHFGQRVARTSLHRRLKGAELSYEDEKYSYVVLSRVACSPARGRVIRRPGYRPGLVELEVCRGTEIRSERISKAQGGRYRAARKAAWGSAWDREPHG